MSTKYFPTIRDPFKAPYLHQKVYKVGRAYNDAGGIFHPEETLVMEPNSLGCYIVEHYGEKDEKGNLTEFGKIAQMQFNSMVAHKAASRGRIIGPFDSPDEAAIEERKVRPKTDKEKLEAALYRAETAERKLNEKGKDK